VRAWGGLGSAALRLLPLMAVHDVVHCNSQKAFAAAAAAAWLARRPVLWHLRDMLTPEHFSAAMRRLAVRTANLFAARVVCNSQATARAFVAAGGHARLVRVLYNGIDASAFADEPPSAARDALGLVEGFTVGCFSRLSPWKGQHVLLQALGELPGVRALVVGEALFGEEEYARGLRRQAERLGVADRVRFLGFRSDVPRLMAACDVIAHTSVAPEPFGRVIVEGMLAGRPVVATDAGGAREIVAHAENGLLVPPGDAAALAAAIRSLRADPARARALAASGRRLALDRFSRAGMARGFGEVVREVWPP
jgi:glycosyltransferase involved in cell wall biosynthesis